MDADDRLAHQFTLALSIALGLLFLAGIGVVVLVVLSGRRGRRPPPPGA